MALTGKDAIIDELRSVLAADGRVRLALLFGSWARNEARADSDVDIALDAPEADLLALSARISERLGKEVDVVALSSPSIPLLEQLIADGVVVYEAERGRSAAWRSSVLSQLETDRPWYRRMRDAWLARVAHQGLGDGR